MKILFSALILFFALNAQSVTVEVFGKQGEPLLFANMKYALPYNVGEISIIAFDQYGISYQGDASGIASIFDLGSAIEVVSDTEMKAFGWCFAIDGAVVETMPDKTEVLSEDSVIRWYYAYAHYKDGDWIRQCVRAHE